jgi:hypothetical protein
MTIKSNIRTFGFWYSILGGVFGIGMFISFCFYIQMDFLPKLFSFVVIAILLITVGKILWDGNIINIDTDLKTITFKNRFTLISKRYNITYFDGYVFTYEPMKFKYPKNIYLVKNGVFLKKISSFIYSNHSEIEKGLFPLKNLGEVKYTHWNSFKIFIGRPII